MKCKGTSQSKTFRIPILNPKEFYFCEIYCGLSFLHFSRFLGHSWHPEHFRCYHCRCVLRDARFHVHQGVPYCRQDYAELFLKKCADCGLPIEGVVVAALGQTWHRYYYFLLGQRLWHLRVGSQCSYLSWKFTAIYRICIVEILVSLGLGSIRV